MNRNNEQYKHNNLHNLHNLRPLAVNVVTNNETNIDGAKHLSQINPKVPNVFTSGESIVANIDVFNKNEYTVNYEVELYISGVTSGSDMVSSSGSGIVTIESLSHVLVGFSLNAPVDEKRYYVFLSIKVDSVQVLLNKICDINVVNKKTEPPLVEFIGWERR